jgi:protein-tyrosine phosphatase/nicotinamidase-related amidase
MTSILFTQCLQHDFVRPLERYEALPNLLHIGYPEALRLMGERPDQGPLRRVMSWAYEEAPENLSIIHLRDWHDPNDAQQADHLKRFGKHCLQNTPGADFVFDHDPARNGVSVIDSLSLNDFQGTGLAKLLDTQDRLPVRVGIVGAWTEAKVYFLAYELRTRYPSFEIVVCSALTASSSRVRHFEALEQMERILGVRVVHSVGEFVEFLGGGELETPLLGLRDRFPEIQCPLDLAEQDRILLRYLFRDCKSLSLRVLDGGFSGNLVLGTNSEDVHGHDQVPHVVKIGPQDLMGKERAAFEQIQDVLGNNAPHISDFADYGDRGAIKYRYASMGGSFSTTFQKMVENGEPQGLIDDVLRSVFGEQLQRLYKARTLEETDLLLHYQFSPRWAPSVRRRVEALVGSARTGEELCLGGGLKAPNLVDFYEHSLATFEAGGRCFQAYVHGDLNGANIIVDGHQNVWLIDFFHTRRAHVLMDLIKLENDLLYIFTKLDSEDELRSGCALFDRLLDIEDLAAPLPPAHFSAANFQRCWDTLRTLRSFYPPLISSDRSPYQWWVGALRYAAHSLGFDECSLLQKKWALYAAGHLASRIVQQHTHERRLRVDWIQHDLDVSGRIGLTILPGRADRDRILERDLEALHEQGVEAVLCMVPQQELAAYGVPQLLDAYHEAGFQVLHLPVIDQKVCSLSELEQAVNWLQIQTSQGRSVLAHCVGGLGRSGFALAAYLVHHGMSPQEAIQTIRESRSPRAVETQVQEALVREFAELEIC